MYCILVGAGLGDCQALRRATAVTRQIMPTLGGECCDRFVELPEIQGGWSYILPAALPKRPLVSESQNARTAVLAFGEVYGSSAAAERIAAAFERGKVDAVRELDGSFSAVIVDRLERTLYVIGDRMGRRTLRHFSDGSRLLISTHDVPIVATRHCPVDYDLVSAGSIVAVEWSLGGRSVVRSIEVGDAHSYLCWNGRLQRVQSPALTFAHRVAANDRRGLRESLELMLETFRQHAEVLSVGEDEMVADLTAGMDSRAALAVLLRAVEPERLTVYTAGGPASLDVRVARRIAERYGLRHETSVPERATAPLATFLENSRVLAFFTNGDTNSKRAACGRIRYDPEARLHWGAGGGEIFRGYYYPLSRAPLTADDALRILKKKTLIDVLPWSDNRLASELAGRLEDNVGGWSRFSPDGHDVLDLYYLYERFGRRGLGARMPQEAHHYFLFERGAAVRAAMMLPAPIGYHCPLHEELIRRWLPATYWWPVNRRTILPIERLCGPWHISQFAKRCAKGLLARRARPAPASHESDRARLLADYLKESLRDLLLATGSISRQLLAPQGLVAMIDEHASGRTSYLETLGLLITLEQWKLQIEEAQRVARA